MKKNILYKSVPTELQPEERLFFSLGCLVSGDDLGG